MASLELTTRSAEETQELGASLGALLGVGDLCLLHGTLGSGKTTLTQGIARGAGFDGYAHSPTFVMVHEYAARLPLYHVDLYRAEGGRLEVHDLAVDEMLTKGACVVEWAEKGVEVFPPEHLSVTLEHGERPDDRRIVLTPHGARYDGVLAELQNARRTGGRRRPATAT